MFLVSSIITGLIRILFHVKVCGKYVLALNCARGDVAISRGDFGVLKNIRSNIEFASKGDLRPLIQWSPSL